jgi:hypothetical protein
MKSINSVLNNAREGKMSIKQTKLQSSRMILIVVGLFLVCSFATSFAQDVARGAAQGTVVPLIVVTAVQPLDFGTLFQGVPKTILRGNDDSCAIFAITGEHGAGINLQLVLPEYLNLANGSDRMPIVFRITDAAVDTNAATPSTVVAGDGWVDQNPYFMPAAATIGAVNTRIYLGGKVNPSTNQAAGAYSNDIVLMVAYNNQ